MYSLHSPPAGDYHRSPVGQGREGEKERGRERVGGGMQEEGRKEGTRIRGGEARKNEKGKEE